MDYNLKTLDERFQGLHLCHVKIVKNLSWSTLVGKTLDIFHLVFLGVVYVGAKLLSHTGTV